MGRNKDSLIELAAKLTGENCGEVKTKKDALKKIACFYAGEEVECNTVADALQCIASHCEGGSGGSANLIDYTLSIPKISEALQNGNTEILPEDADGFKSIKLNNFRLNKLTVTANGTYSCGGYGSPYFYNEVEVNIEGSPYFEAKSVSPSSEPITLDLNGKAFGAITTFGANGNGYGAYINPSVVSNSYSIDIMNGGSRAGTVNWNAEDKLLTYTPNPSYPMGSTNITFILF